MLPSDLLVVRRRSSVHLTFYDVGGLILLQDNLSSRLHQHIDQYLFQESHSTTTIIILI